MDVQAQYKEGLRDLNRELKTKREELKEVEHQKEKLQEEVTSLCQQVETAGTDAVQKFKMSQSYVDSCADFMALGLKIASNKLRQLSQSWTCLESQ